MTSKSHSSYTSSINYDRRMYREDIAGSVAHAHMLAKQGIIEEEEAEVLVKGLHDIFQEIEKETFPWQESLEDIHMNIEARLFEIVGDVAGKLHTARSRNDQVVTDLRLYAKDTSIETIKQIRALQEVLVDQGQVHRGSILPGYTHLQRAQPVLLAHHLMAHFQALQRDVIRFEQSYRSADVMPLGSGALAGVPYEIDRNAVAKELGFSRISENSLDAVSDRDFLLDYQSAAATCMAHLSRLSEEVVLWSSEEFGFLHLSDEHTTGSSIMPQKRNPDLAELARGKTGRVYGHLIGLLTILKGLPLSYNRDLQEDKEGFFDTRDTLLATLNALAQMLKQSDFDVKRMYQAAEQSQSLATDLADYLVVRGIPFREAHGIVGRLARRALERGQLLTDLSLQEYQQFSVAFDNDVYKITLETSVAARRVPGGTSQDQVDLALERARLVLEKDFGI
jgi:argininosuccinate lyase